MADDLLLFYLIEGTTKPSYISVSYNSNGKPVKVDDLRKTIFEDDCKHLVTTSNHKNLTLLKVCILLFISPMSAVMLTPLIVLDRYGPC